MSGRLKRLFRDLLRPRHQSHLLSMSDVDRRDAAELQARRERKRKNPNKGWP